MINELGGNALVLPEKLAISHMALPFGRVASPPYFQISGEAIQALRESYGLEDEGWSGSGYFPHLSFTRATQSGWEMISDRGQPDRRRGNGLANEY